MGAVTNTNCYLNVKLNQVRKWIIETLILAARERVCRGGSVAAQVEQLLPKWDVGTPRRCPGGGSARKLGTVWNETQFTGKFACWKEYCNECALFSVNEASANLRFPSWWPTHPLSGQSIRENIQHAQDAAWKRHHILCCTRHSAA